MERQREMSPFHQTWLYRRNFSLTPGEGTHFLLETHGITPGADIFVNGIQIASRASQSGSYGGQIYDITSVAGTVNKLVVKVFPTDYQYDLALGFMDWNPYPLDNGTGVWRNITIKQTGPVCLGPLSVGTKFLDSSLGHVQLSFRAVARNLENRTVTVVPSLRLNDPGIRSWNLLAPRLEIAPLASREVIIAANHTGLRPWWPKQWGGQPLLEADFNITVDNIISDFRRTLFGIREVTAKLNEHKDVIFHINKRPFQVIGAGYAPDIFLRWDRDRFSTIAGYALDIGLNTIRLEGKMEQPELYEIADRLGVMILPGWECCGKWEAWKYNDELDLFPVPVWSVNDYSTANTSMRHEAAMLQTHPSVLGFMIGSDFAPNDKATTIYVDALKEAGWQTPIISSGSKRGYYPELLGPSGMKMEGPYDWVPPNYWWDTKPYAHRLGAAFGFGSELGAGVGTPEIGSLLKFLNWEDIDQLWKAPNDSFYHNGRGKTFSSRRIYNNALWNRHGPATGLDDYLLKAQMMDYEATRAQFEAYSAKWSAERPATGIIYWMLNNAFPSLHWNLIDWNLRAGGSYFGAKTRSRLEHVAYDYVNRDIYLINRSLARRGPRTIDLDIIDQNGTTVSHRAKTVTTEPNTSKDISFRVHELDQNQGLVFLRLHLLDEQNMTMSRNVYWLSNQIDDLNWRASKWYYTPVKTYTDFKGLDRIPQANITVQARRSVGATSRSTVNVTLVNHSAHPAVFIRLNLHVVNHNKSEQPQAGGDVVPVKWEDNYVTLWPYEKLVLCAEPMADINFEAAFAVQVKGKNIDTLESVYISPS